VLSGVGVAALRKVLDVPTRKVEKRLDFCTPRMYTDFSFTMFVGDFCDHFCALTLYACTENMAHRTGPETQPEKHRLRTHLIPFLIKLLIIS
jgi:hypothetical protein